MQPIVECVPNFSEGRRQDVIEAIVASISAVAGVHVLDVHSDEDHNRSVVTVVGPPEAVLESAYAGIARAAEHIDMEAHEGEHPRLGATDVVPFIPIAELSMEDCVALARRLGERVGEELGIPVYLYEAAATRPERVNLADVRRGEYEALKDSIGADPAREPDFGPQTLASAGATIIGARAPLIAFNVYLTTEDDSIAKKIAKTIRHSSGGLRFVKSVGLLVEGRAQVSMNLTDYSRTPIAAVVEMIRREAARYGVGIHHSELVGLAPQDALLEAARWYLQLDDFDRDQVLENRLFAVSAETADTEAGFLDRLAAGTPTPGGGSAAAHVAATSAALLGMVARLTVGKKKYAEVEDRMINLAEESDSLRVWFLEAAARDEAAFEGVMEALRMPKETEAEQSARTAALESATHRAAAVPLEVVKACVDLLRLAVEAADKGNVNAASDAGSAGAMAEAALRSAALNVRINAQSANDKEAAASWLESLKAHEVEAKQEIERLGASLEERAGLDF